MKYDNFKDADDMQNFIDGMKPIFKEVNKTTNIYISDENGNILFDEHGLTKEVGQYWMKIQWNFIRDTMTIYDMQGRFQNLILGF